MYGDKNGVWTDWAVSDIFLEVDITGGSHLSAIWCGHSALSLVGLLAHWLQAPSQAVCWEAACRLRANETRIPTVWAYFKFRMYGAAGKVLECSVLAPGVTQSSIRSWVLDCSRVAWQLLWQAGEPGQT